MNLQMELSSLPGSQRNQQKKFVTKQSVNQLDQTRGNTASHCKREVETDSKVSHLLGSRWKAPRKEEVRESSFHATSDPF
jgi:hypothetical protein